MTAIAGFHCNDGLLMCSDMEEGYGSSKRSVQKLYREVCGTGNDQWEYVVGGSGSTLVIDNYAGRLRNAMESLTPFDKHVAEKVIERNLKIVYEDYVWPNKSGDHSIELLIALAPRKQEQPKLIRTVDIVPAQPSVNHIAIGIGADMVNYFADRLFTASFKGEDAIRLAAFIFREVKEAVSGCGQKTEMWFLPRDGSPGTYISPAKIEDLENDLPDTSDMLTAMWKTADKAMPLKWFLKK